MHHIKCSPKKQGERQEVSNHCTSNCKHYKECLKEIKAMNRLTKKGLIEFFKNINGNN
jgi:hypothetical protein